MSETRTCQARLTPHMVCGPAGWPEYAFRGRCRQVVGVRHYVDALNVERAYCSAPGHREDVDEQATSALLAERVRHELEEQRPLSNDVFELRAIRPELARYGR